MKIVRIVILSVLLGVFAFTAFAAEKEAAGTV